MPRAGASKAAMAAFEASKAAGTAGTGIVGGARAYYQANPQLAAPIIAAQNAGNPNADAMRAAEMSRAAAETQAQAYGSYGDTWGYDDTGGVPEFDWAAWNDQMMAQQQAVWASMDAMNAEFLAQQEALRAKNLESSKSTISGYSSSQADSASVKRKKRTKKTGSTVNTEDTNKTLSLGGSNTGASNGLSIGKQT